MSVGARADAVLSIRNLVVEFDSPEGVVRAVDGVSYDVEPGTTLGVVGESGCGKTVTVLAVLGLLPRSGRIVSGEILLDGQDLVQMRRRQLRRIRGKRIAMVFQDPMTSLHPVFPVGHQIVEALRTHDDSLTPAAARARAADLLALVGVPDATARLRTYPHQWSGGMRQRAMIAMAIANRPALLIADEPTTALDVTIQAQVLDVLRVAQRETGAAAIVITHDLGIIAELADRVAVMYAGGVVETGTAAALFSTPRHPYTLGLLRGLPRLDTDVDRLVPIPGQPPSLIARPSGCAFHPRCRLRSGRELCVEQVPPLLPVRTTPPRMARGDPTHRSACHFAEEMATERGATVGEAGADRGQR